jgi:deazaflavin-dependent oxidoreductase (nitroreductase family)
MNSRNRFLMRAPIGLYRIRLGWLLGTRFLLLEHTGRTSGMQRQTVLEVVEIGPEGRPVIVSGFGARSQWCKNITADPSVTVTWGKRRFEANAERRSQGEALGVFERYRAAHPRAARVLGGSIGVSLVDDLDLAAERLPVFTLVPVRAASTKRRVE